VKTPKWKQIEDVLTTHQLHHLYAHVLVPGCGTISCDREKNLRILANTIPTYEVAQLYRIPTIGHKAVRRLVGIFYRLQPSCMLVRSFFER